MGHTYLKSAVRGRFFYLYLSRICPEHGLDQRPVVLHADNGASMKGATMLATLQRLGVVPSFSRPSVSNDNAYSEALFRTLKFHPWYSSRPFGAVAEATTWGEAFVR